MSDKPRIETPAEQRLREIGDSVSRLNVAAGMPTNPEEREESIDNMFTIRSLVAGRAAIMLLRDFGRDDVNVQDWDMMRREVLDGCEK